MTDPHMGQFGLVARRFSGLEVNEPKILQLAVEERLWNM